MNDALITRLIEEIRAFRLEMQKLREVITKPPQWALFDAQGHLVVSDPTAHEQLNRLRDRVARGPGD